MKTILSIDDTVETLNLHKFVLELEGFCVQTAGNGIEALKVLATGPSIDLILCDIQMPLMTGLEFVIELKQSFPKIAREVPIVLTSGSNIALPAGVAGQISKMTDLDTFIQKIRSILTARDMKLTI